MQCAGIVGAGLLMALLRSGWRILLMGSARDLERGIRDELYTHMLSLDTAYYDKTRAGDIMAHATSDILHVRMAFGFGIIALVDTLLLGSACIGIMVWTSPKLATLCRITSYNVCYTKLLRVLLRRFLGPIEGEPSVYHGGEDFGFQQFFGSL